MKKEGGRSLSWEEGFRDIFLLILCKMEFHFKLFLGWIPPDQSWADVLSRVGSGDSKPAAATYYSEALKDSVFG